MAARLHDVRQSEDAMIWIIITKKATASAVNISIVSASTLPIYYFLGLNIWRVSCIISFFLYSLLLSHRCFGQMVAGTYQNQPTNLAFAALYTAGFTTVIYWIWFPFDLALANGLFVQMPCLLVFGNTLHGLATGRQTMTQVEHDFECIALRGQCPDCNAIKLEHVNSIIYCRGCHAAFMAGEVFVQRVTLGDKILPTAEIIKKGHAFGRSPESDRV
jgi:hypothetical protein